jgi:hypothetical protein
MFQVLYHLLHGDIIIAYRRRFAIATYAHEFKFNDECGLMGLGAFGNAEGMVEGKVVCFVADFHSCIKPIRFY